LQAGTNVVVAPVVIYDFNQQVWYSFKHGGEYTFKKDDVGHWFVQNKSKQNDDFVNFFFEYRKQVEPFLPEKDMSPDEMYIQPALLKNLNTRDESI
jgi:hypothetical protein